MYGEYKEYHTSLDNEKFISFKTIEDTIKIYYEILLTIENNFIPYARVQFGTPQLSKSKVDLYPKMMDFVTKPRALYLRLMLIILNLAEGTKDLLSICNEKNYKLIDHLDLYKKLLQANYIKKLSSE